MDSSRVGARASILLFEELVPDDLRGWLAFGSLFVAAAILVIALGTSEPLRAVIASVVFWVRDAGLVGVIAFLVIYLVATVLLVPGSLLAFSAGVAYGVVLGSVLTVIAAALAMCVPFLLGRRLLRPRLAPQLARRPRLAAIDRAIAQEGAKIVFLLRLSPVVPYNLLNYALSATRVSPADYLAASVIGFTPGAVLTVYIGAAVSRTSELDAEPHDTASAILFWGGLVATIIATIVLTRTARKALATVVEDNPDSRPETAPTHSAAPQSA